MSNTRPYQEFDGVIAKEYWDKKDFVVVEATYRDAGKFVNEQNREIEYDEAWKFKVICIKDDTQYKQDHIRANERLQTFEVLLTEEPKDFDLIQDQLKNTGNVDVKLIEPIGRVFRGDMRIEPKDIKVTQK